jgi:hypothetical protein
VVGVDEKAAVPPCVRFTFNAKNWCQDDKHYGQHAEIDEDLFCDS